VGAALITRFFVRPIEHIRKYFMDIKKLGTNKILMGGGGGAKGEESLEK
jgi:hypothetical protein